MKTAIDLNISMHMLIIDIKVKILLKCPLFPVEGT